MAGRLHTPRGMLIAVEGLDRAGKSTQCQQLVKHLQSRGLSAELIRFPDRSTPTGQLINKFLKKEVELPDRTIHLLFSANRWELASRIEELINSDTWVILDRYIPSGIVYSLSKEPRPFDLKWAIGAEMGLPAPDLVIMLLAGESVVEQRGGFGEERFEEKEMQKRVKNTFEELREWWDEDAPKTWEFIHGGQEIEKVSDDIAKLIDHRLGRGMHIDLQKFGTFGHFTWINN